MSADVKYPFAAAARCYHNRDARQRFINGTRDNALCPYRILRGIGRRPRGR